MGDLVAELADKAGCVQLVDLDQVGTQAVIRTMDGQELGLTKDDLKLPHPDHAGWHTRVTAGDSSAGIDFRKELEGILACHKVLVERSRKAHKRRGGAQQEYRAIGHIPQIG